MHAPTTLLRPFIINVQPGMAQCSIPYSNLLLLFLNPHYSYFDRFLQVGSPFSRQSPSRSPIWYQNSAVTDSIYVVYVHVDHIMGHADFLLFCEVHMEHCKSQTKGIRYRLNLQTRIFSQIPYWVKLLCYNSQGSLHISPITNDQTNSALSLQENSVRMNYGIVLTLYRTARVMLVIRQIFLHSLTKEI